MTEKKIFVFKLFLTINVSDFGLLFYVKTPPPLKKVFPFFPNNPPLGVQPLPPAETGGAHFDFALSPLKYR